MRRDSHGSWPGHVAQQGVLVWVWVREAARLEREEGVEEEEEEEVRREREEEGWEEGCQEGQGREQEQVPHAGQGVWPCQPQDQTHGLGGVWFV